jgi:hypothetical protein
MADDETVRALNRRIEELAGENAQLKSEAKDRRIKGRKAHDELDLLRKDHDAAVKERDSWKTKAEASHPELVNKVEELQGVIRLGKHQAVFQEAAERAGIDPKSPQGKQALADLWTLSGYKAEADEPDAGAIESAIGAAKQARPYLFGQARAADAGPPADPTKPPRLTTPIDTTRGGGNLSPDVFRVTSENLQDLGWMTRNAAKIKQHREAGTLVFA